MNFFTPGILLGNNPNYQQPINGNYISEQGSFNHHNVSYSQGQGLNGVPQQQPMSNLCAVHQQTPLTPPPGLKARVSPQLVASPVLLPPFPFAIASFLQPTNGQGAIPSSSPSPSPSQKRVSALPPAYPTTPVATNGAPVRRNTSFSSLNSASSYSPGGSLFSTPFRSDSPQQPYSPSNYSPSHYSPGQSRSMSPHLYSSFINQQVPYEDFFVDCRWFLNKGVGSYPLVLQKGKSVTAFEYPNSPPVINRNSASGSNAEIFLLESVDPEYRNKVCIQKSTNPDGSHFYTFKYINNDGQLLDIQDTNKLLAMQEKYLMYFGEWLNGKPHGVGSITYFNGIIEKGIWNEGKRHGLMRFVSAGKTYECLYQNGITLGKWAEIDNERISLDEIREINNLELGWPES